METDHRRQMRRKTVVALVHKLIAVRNQLISLRIRPRIIQQRLPGHRVAIGSRNRHHVAKAVSIRIEGAAAALLPQVVLLALARRAVAHALVKVRRGLVVHRAAEEQVLVLLRRAVRNVIEVPCARNPRRIHPIVQRGANLCAPARLPAHVGRRRGQVILIVGQIVSGLQPAERSQVIELVMSPGNLQFLARRIEVARIAMEQQRRKTRCPVRSRQTYHAAGRIRAIQARIGPTIDLRALHGRRRQRPEIEAPAQIPRTHPVHKNLV